jgi:hypothetical protein
MFPTFVDLSSGFISYFGSGTHWQWNQSSFIEYSENSNRNCHKHISEAYIFQFGGQQKFRQMRRRHRANCCYISLFGYCMSVRIQIPYLILLFWSNGSWGKLLRLMWITEMFLLFKRALLPGFLKIKPTMDLNLKAFSKLSPWAEFPSKKLFGS